MKLFRRCGIYKNYPLSQVIVRFNVKARFIGLTFGRYAIGVMIDETKEDSPKTAAEIYNELIGEYKMLDVDVDDFGAEADSGNSSSRPASRDDDDNSDEKPRGALTQWGSFGSKEWVGCEKTQLELEAAMYTFREHHDGRMIFKQLPINVDDLLRFPDGLTDSIMTEIDSFWRRGELFAARGFLHRRGYLFYGPQGSGKSSIVQQIVKDIIDRHGVVFLCERPDHLDKSLQVFRQIERERQVVCIFEDIDAIIKEHGEDKILSLLDGENQINRVLNIATTNYPERLDQRLISRPRRFDRVTKISQPDEAVRRFYFENKLKGEKDIERWISESAGLSFAALAEMVISVHCLGNTFEETVRTLKKMSQAKQSSEEYKDQKVGFGGKRERD